MTGGLPGGTVSVRLRAPGGESTVRLHPKSRHELHLPIAARRVWTATLTADQPYRFPMAGSEPLAPTSDSPRQLLKDRPPPADRNAVTITLSPPIRIFGIVGILAAAALGLLLFMQSRSSHTTAATPPSTAGKLHASTSAPAVRPSTRPARPAAPKIVLLPGLPEPVAHALRYSKVVVVSLYAAGASGDRAALAQARLGAASAHAGFAAVNVLNERIALGLDRFAGASSSPTVLVVRRPGRIVNRFNGYTDSDLVAQAAQNAGARGSR